MTATLGGDTITLGRAGGSGCSFVSVFFMRAVTSADGGVVIVVLLVDIALKTIVIGGDRSIGLIEI